MRTVVYTGTRNVYADMAVACKSLLIHNGADRVIFLIEDDAFPGELPPIVETMNVSGQKFFPPDGPNYSSLWTYMAMMKAAVPLILTGRVLLLDCDTIIHGSLDGLWSLPDAPIYMARETRVEEYYNAGVILMDCEAMREDAPRIIDLINTQPMLLCDQDAINQVMAGRISALPPEYNASPWTLPPDALEIITHYAGERRWQWHPLWQSYAVQPWPR